MTDDRRELALLLDVLGGTKKYPGVYSKLKRDVLKLYDAAIKARLT